MTMTNDENKIVYDKKGAARAFVGPDAVNYFRAAVLRSALGLLARGIKPNRMYTVKAALAAAGEYTGKTYKRSEIEQARADLAVWIATMKAALPSETES
jgi:hypothetical protein